jgi:hypothetical protein
VAEIVQLRKIDSLPAAIRYGDEWQAHANRMQALLLLATAQRDASELLLRFAEDEIERLRNLL